MVTGSVGGEAAGHNQTLHWTGPKTVLVITRGEAGATLSDEHRSTFEITLTPTLSRITGRGSKSWITSVRGASCRVGVDRESVLNPRVRHAREALPASVESCRPTNSQFNMQPCRRRHLHQSVQAKKVDLAAEKVGNARWVTPNSLASCACVFRLKTRRAQVVAVG
jgi:hypothetical protein